MHINSIIEIINVSIAYYLLVIVLTSFMIKPITKDKSIFIRFIMYLIIGNFYIINIVFILAFLSMFNRFTLLFILVITSIIIRVFLDKKQAKNSYKQCRETVSHLLRGEYGAKLFFINKISQTKYKIKLFFDDIFMSKKIEWITFLSILCYNIYYYSYNSVHFLSFGAPDEEVHLYWVQSLISGNIFPSGVYPYGFHNILSAITVIFGFNAVTVINVFSVVSTTLIMVMLYFGLRKILYSKYAALFGFALFSLLNVYNVDSYYRYQFSIPQEYGMILLMPMAIFLFRYLEDKKITDLVIFGMCLSMTISIHFYITIIALVLCIAIGLVYIYKIFKEKLFFKLVLVGILSATIAIAPLAVGLALGYKMEQSMDWAVRVIEGVEYGDTEGTDNIQEETETSFDINTFLIDAEKEITRRVFTDIKVMYVFLGLIALTIFYNLLFIIFKNKKERNLRQIAFAINGLLLVFLILSRPLEIPTLMESKRVAIFFAYFSPLLMAIPFEIAYRIIEKRKVKKICSIFTLVSIPIAILVIMKVNLVRTLPPFYYFQTKGAMLVNYNIINNYNDYDWTIVSPVNDLSVIMNNGFHYELSDFILEQEDWNGDNEIRIPTKYVFIYIEKKPIVLYGYKFYKEDKAIIDRDYVTYEAALEPLDIHEDSNIYYQKYRDIIMSKAYLWAKEYIKYFPKEMNVYYEDDELIVYRIVQNEYALNNFAINYGPNIRINEK